MCAKFLSVQIFAPVHAQDTEMMGDLIKCWFLCLLWIRVLNSGSLLPEAFVITDLFSYKGTFLASFLLCCVTQLRFFVNSVCTWTL